MRELHATGRGMLPGNWRLSVQRDGFNGIGSYVSILILVKGEKLGIISRILTSDLFYRKTVQMILLSFSDQSHILPNSSKIKF